MATILDEAVVDERALVAELTSGRITAALNVYKQEPLVPSDLRSMPSVTFTPHIRSWSVGARAQMTEIAVSSIHAALRSDPVPFPAAVKS